MIERLDTKVVVPELQRHQDPSAAATGRRDFDESLKKLEPPRRHPPEEENESRRQESSMPLASSAVPVTDTYVALAGMEVDAQLLPWQLLPHMGLSYLGRGDEMPLSIAAAAEGEKGEPTLSHVGNMGAASGPQGGAAIEHDDHQAGIDFAIEVVVPYARPDEGGSTEAARMPSLALAGLPDPWADRLVRWIESASHGKTAWVRDFHLDEAAASRLVRDLIEYGKNHAVALDRIVINGKECWRADATTTKGMN